MKIGSTFPMTSHPYTNFHLKPKRDDEPLDALRKLFRVITQTKPGNEGKGAIVKSCASKERRRTTVEKLPSIAEKVEPGA
jgi:hypothetical protein